jgi:predicted enzyme involved in methoxymalonyl-ACP biosynthesis
VRWSEADAATYFEQGGVWWSFDVADRFTHYGLVGLTCVKGTEVTQFVMSCRVAGLDVELAALAVTLRQCAPDGTQFEATVQATESNAVSRDIFRRIGWSQTDGHWRGGAPAALPPHITSTQAL